jgi:hypothetical protein
MQWPRYCLENYLIDIDAITELLKMEDVANEPGAKAGEVSAALRALAMKQLDDLVLREAYTELGYKSPSFTLDDIEGREPSDAATLLYDRAMEARNSIPDEPGHVWTQKFLTLRASKRKAMELEWETSWRERCNGKRLFRDFQRLGRLRISSHIFKRRIMQQIRATSSENWTLLSGLLTNLLKI